MKKYYASLIFVIFAITSCSIQEIKYIPLENSLMQIEFMYPAHWIWEQDLSTSYQALMINDPEWTTPTATIRPDFYQEEKFIHIYTRSPTNGKSVEEHMNSIVEEVNKKYWPLGPIEQRINDDILFHGVPGKHILIEREHFSLEKNKYVGEYIEYYFFRTADRWYRVMMIIPVDERNGSFGKAFDRIIETIEIRNP